MTRAILTGFITIALVGAISCNSVKANSVSEPAGQTTKPVLTEKAAAKKLFFEKKTYTYKVVGDVNIEADVYHFADKKKRPVLVWIHGGALIIGDKAGLPRGLSDSCLKEGCIVISLNYRLAPEVKVPAIVEDIQDAFGWIRKEGPKLFNADPDKIIVMGASAGGYLTMMTGICVEPKPKALIAYYGFGAIDSDWVTKPSGYALRGPKVEPKPEVLKAVSGKVITGIGKGKKALGRARYQYHLYLRQNGLWLQEAGGFPKGTAREKITPYCPVRNITADYPPILMVHGTKDGDVPYKESVAMAKELTQHGVKHELITIKGAGHGLRGATREQIGDTLAKVEEFIEEYLK